MYIAHKELVNNLNNNSQQQQQQENEEELRGPSLMDLHLQKKYEKDHIEKQNNMNAEGKQTRRPFDREKVS